MPSNQCERAISDVQQAGKAVVKFISPNDVDLTGGHQYGFLLPKANDAWKSYTQIAPQKGVNLKEKVAVTWPDGRVTQSTITWYGEKKHEYRLSGFGKNFPFRTFNNVGDLLVLIPFPSFGTLRAYVLSTDEDFEELEASLGISLEGVSATYPPAIDSSPDRPEDCLSKKFKAFVDTLSEFPDGRTMATLARSYHTDCFPEARRWNADRLLLEHIDSEFKLFKMVEEHLCGSMIKGPFSNIDDFLSVAQTITQRRKARAGRSLENHVESLLLSNGIPHKMRPTIDGEPDVIIPSEEAYYNPAYDESRLWMLGVKTTCKDRWRQVLNEAKRCRTKYLLTLQQGVTQTQLQQMSDANLVLVVPDRVHNMYPPGLRNDVLMSLESFFEMIRSRIG